MGQSRVLMQVFDADSGQYFPIIAGGDDTLTFEGDPSPAGDGGAGKPMPDGSGSSPASGRKPDGDWIPRHRFNEVNTQFQTLKPQFEAYAKLGTVEQIAEKLKRAEEFGKDRTFTPTETERVRRELFEAMPEFRVWQQERELRTQHATRTAIGKLDGWLGELGVTKTKDNEADFTKRASQLEHILTAVIAADPVMTSRAAVHDLTVFDEAWKEFKRTYGIGQTRRQQDAKLLQMKHPSPKPAAASSKPEGKPEEEKTEREILEEANAKAMEMLGALEEA